MPEKTPSPRRAAYLRTVRREKRRFNRHLQLVPAKRAAQQQGNLCKW